MDPIAFSTLAASCAPLVHTRPEVRLRSVAVARTCPARWARLLPSTLRGQRVDTKEARQPLERMLAQIAHSDSGTRYEIL